jgi:hypothetical protein
LHDTSSGSDAGVIFGCETDGQHGTSRHGNFHSAAYAAIYAEPDWLRRLGKVHTASRRSRARKDWQWMELDSAVSSDALLMNVFCHPEVFDGKQLSPGVAALLNIDAAAGLCFGMRPGVPLKPTGKERRGKSKTVREPVDRTEIDLVVTTAGATLFVEAKLTESGFQTAAPRLIARYRDLEAVFEVDRLPRKILTPAALPENVDADDPTVNLPARVTRIRVGGYQLVRNVLATYSVHASFCVLADARRHDLIEEWYAVLSAVHSPMFATKLKMLTWQELAAALPQDLRQFLARKYGIEG